MTLEELFERIRERQIDADEICCVIDNDNVSIGRQWNDGRDYVRLLDVHPDDLIITLMAMHGILAEKA